MCTNSTPSRSPKIVLGTPQKRRFLFILRALLGHLRPSRSRPSPHESRLSRSGVEKIASWNTKRLAHKQKIQGTSKPKPEEPKVVQEEEWQAGTTHKKRIAHGSAKPLEISEAVTNLLKASASKTLCGGKQRGYMMKALNNKFRRTAKKKSGGPVHVTF
ncbi:hypothetical protein L596_024762 [Steinernema carpocapsae]|uniref:Uncharacterized protein n=1 Tax=Steinernema carpocapsae TaxID=34508 RepID=A0A4U5M5U3_STECR|nr:hypothetical protein L596_024762 [Steinernema carpocapsae]